MSDPDPSQVPEATAPPLPGAEAAALPEFLNPESTHYQPWAEKQIFNASKDKRPLAEFMANFEERLQAYPEMPPPRWDPGRQEQLLARFAVAAPGRVKRRRRRRGAAAPAAGPAGLQASGRPAEAGRGQRRKGGEPQTAVPPATVGSRPASPGGGEHRRRRRRRSRGGGSGTTPPVA